MGILSNKKGGDKANYGENGLALQFQWHEGLDPEYIFEEERKMIKTLRGRIPQLACETDKFVAAFLFSRHHDLPETEAVLTTFYERKALVSHLFPGQHFPTFKYSNLAELLSIGGVSMLEPRGFRDNKGRMLRFFIMERETTSLRTVEHALLAGFWQTYYRLATEPLNAWRCGMVVIMDMKNAGFKNIDLSLKGRDILVSMQGVFPFRFRKIIIINGGMVINAILTAAKVVLPKKLVSRIKLMKESELSQVIPQQYLFQHYGGASPVWFDEFSTEIFATEDSMFAQGIFPAPLVDTQ